MSGDCGKAATILCVGCRDEASRSGTFSKWTAGVPGDRRLREAKRAPTWSRESTSRDAGLVPDREIDPWRPAVIARCLDEIARAVDRISDIAREINLRNTGS